LAVALAVFSAGNGAGRNGETALKASEGKHHFETKIRTLIEFGFEALELYNGKILTKHLNVFTPLNFRSKIG